MKATQRANVVETQQSEPEREADRMSDQIDRPEPGVPSTNGEREAHVKELLNGFEPLARNDDAMHFGGFRAVNEPSNGDTIAVANWRAS